MHVSLCSQSAHMASMYSPVRHASGHFWRCGQVSTIVVHRLSRKEGFLANEKIQVGELLRQIGGPDSRRVHDILAT